MKPLFIIGLMVLILGIFSFFIPFPHSETHGIKVGDTSIGVKTHDSVPVSPMVSVVLLLAGAGMMIAGRGKS
jgi:hypothetical protein